MSASMTRGDSPDQIEEINANITHPDPHVDSNNNDKTKVVTHSVPSTSEMIL